MTGPGNGNGTRDLFRTVAAIFGGFVTIILGTMYAQIIGLIGDTKESAARIDAFDHRLTDGRAERIKQDDRLIEAMGKVIERLEKLEQNEAQDHLDRHP